jgi:hypothetical protein
MTDNCPAARWRGFPPSAHPGVVLRDTEGMTSELDEDQVVDRLILTGARQSRRVSSDNEIASTRSRGRA